MKTRGFEIVTGYEEIAFMPKRQTLHSAGYDFASCEKVEIKPHEVQLIKTGIKAYMLPDEVLKIYSRSSLIKKKLMLANNVGIIDCDYFNNKNNEGHIFIPLYNFSKEVIIINKGDKIAQGLFQKYFLVDDDCPVQTIRNGGFGSSNK